MEVEYLPLSPNLNTMYIEGKALLSSMTFWLAALQALVGAVFVFQAAYPDVGALLVLKSIADVLLRYLTTKPITGIVSPN